MKRGKAPTLVVILLMLVFYAPFLRAGSESGIEQEAFIGKEVGLNINKMDGRKRFGIGMRTDVVMPQNLGRGESLSGGVEIFFRVSKNFSLQLTGKTFNVNVERDPAGLNKGKLNGMPVQLSFMGCWPIGSHFIPYAAAGFGIHFGSFALDPGLTTGWEQLGFDIEEKINNGFGWHIGIGSDLYVMKNIVLNGEVRYSVFSAEADWSITEKMTDLNAAGKIEQYDLDFISFGLGLRYLF